MYTSLTIRRNDKRVPACFIVTGPNIASQDTLFQQLSGRLKEEIDGSVVTLRSGDATNLKAVLKQVIRDATNQKFEEDELSDHIQDVRSNLSQKPCCANISEPKTSKL